MKYVLFLQALATIAIAGGCSQGKMSAQTATILADVNQRYANYSETISVARAAGYDYIETVCLSVQHNERAVHDLFVMTLSAGFDAASSEGHSDVLGYVLRDAGDRFFGDHLAHESSAVQKAVRDDILYDLGYGEGPITVEEIRRLYPKTFPDSVAF